MYKKIYKNMCFLSILTLVLTVTIVLSACYSVFSTRIKEELKNETLLISDCLKNSNNYKEAIENLSIDMSDKKIVIFSDDANILYDNFNNTENASFFDEVFSNSRETVHSENGFLYYSLNTKNNETVVIFQGEKAIFSTIASVMVLVLVLASLIYIFTILIAIRLTENIIKPIKNVYSVEEEDMDNVYVEIRPFLKRIINQNKEIKRQMEKVKHQKSRLHAITDNINEGLIIIDNEKNILSMNDCTTELFNVNELNYRGKKFSEISDNKILLTSAQKALEGIKNDTIAMIDEKTYQVFCCPVVNGKDEVTGVIMLLFDISEKADSELIRREFSANVSHELKTPLTSIHGFAQVITSGIAKDEDIKNFAKKIEKESSRLIVLIDDIMKLSRLDEGTEAEDKQTVSLKTITKEVCDMLSNRAQEKGIKIILPENDLVVDANINQITEMIYNLCDNAIKYNNPNGEIEIKISNNSISVRDTGIGIPKDAISRIFERFFRVDKSHSKKVNGTGLGLSIVKHIAQANDIKINVESELGKGSVFTVIFNENKKNNVKFTMC